MPLDREWERVHWPTSRARYLIPLACFAVFLTASILFGEWGAISGSAVWFVVFMAELERGRRIRSGRKRGRDRLRESPLA